MWIFHTWTSKKIYEIGFFTVFGNTGNVAETYFMINKLANTVHWLPTQKQHKSNSVVKNENK